MASSNMVTLRGGTSPSSKSLSSSRRRLRLLRDSAFQQRTGTTQRTSWRSAGMLQGRTGEAESMMDDSPNSLEVNSRSVVMTTMVRTRRRRSRASRRRRPVPPLKRPITLAVLCCLALLLLAGRTGAQDGMQRPQVGVLSQDAAAMDEKALMAASASDPKDDEGDGEVADDTDVMDEKALMAATTTKAEEPKDVDEDEKVKDVKDGGGGGDDVSDEKTLMAASGSATEEDEGDKKDDEPNDVDADAADDETDEKTMMAPMVATASEEDEDEDEAEMEGKDDPDVEGVGTTTNDIDAEKGDQQNTEMAPPSKTTAEDEVDEVEEGDEKDEGENEGQDEEDDEEDGGDEDEGEGDAKAPQQQDEGEDEDEQEGTGEAQDAQTEEGSTTNDPSPPTRCTRDDRLEPEDRLRRNQALCDPSDESLRFGLNREGLLGLWDGTALLWSPTSMPMGNRLVFQESDSRLVLYDDDDFRWASPCGGRRESGEVVVRRSGGGVLVSEEGDEVVWMVGLSSEDKDGGASGCYPPVPVPNEIDEEVDVDPPVAADEAPPKDEDDEEEEEQEEDDDPRRAPPEDCEGTKLEPRDPLRRNDALCDVTTDIRFGLNRRGYLGLWNRTEVLWYPDVRGDRLVLQRGDSHLVMYDDDDSVWRTGCRDRDRAEGLYLSVGGDEEGGVLVVVMDRDDEDNGGVVWELFGKDGTESDCYPSTPILPQQVIAGKDQEEDGVDVILSDASETDKDAVLLAPPLPNSTKTEADDVPQGFDPPLVCKGDTLAPREKLFRDEALCDPDDNSVKFGLNEDGYLAMWNSERVIWFPNATGDRFVLQRSDWQWGLYQDGNGGGVRWTTDCPGRYGGAKELHLGKGGMVTVIDPNDDENVAVWEISSDGKESGCYPYDNENDNDKVDGGANSTSTNLTPTKYPQADPPGDCIGGELEAGVKLRTNQSVCIEDGLRFGLNEDGYLGMWDGDGSVIWWPDAKGDRISVQSGNSHLVLYGPPGTGGAVWSTGCRDGDVDADGLYIGVTKGVTVVDEDQNVVWQLMPDGTESDCYPPVNRMDDNAANEDMGNATTDESAAPAIPADANSTAIDLTSSVQDPPGDCIGDMLPGGKKLYRNQSICSDGNGPSNSNSKIRFGLNAAGYLGQWDGPNVIWWPDVKGDRLSLQNSNSHLVLYLGDDSQWRTGCFDNDGADAKGLYLRGRRATVMDEDDDVVWELMKDGNETECYPDIVRVDAPGNCIGQRLTSGGSLGRNESICDTTSEGGVETRFGLNDEGYFALWEDGDVVWWPGERGDKLTLRDDNSNLVLEDEDGDREWRTGCRRRGADAKEIYLVGKRATLLDDNDVVVWELGSDGEESDCFPPVNRTDDVVNSAPFIGANDVNSTDVSSSDGGSGNAAVAPSPSKEDEIAEAERVASMQRALTKFYKATNGRRWKNNANWLDVGKPFSDWFGISERRVLVDIDDDEDGQDVASSGTLSGAEDEGKETKEKEEVVLYSIVLSNNNLVGSIPDDMLKELGEHLEVLVLSHNSGLGGSLPPYLGDEDPSEKMSFRNFDGDKDDKGDVNQALTSTVAATSKPRLKMLQLSHCAFSGDIPESLYGLTSLEGLYLNDNPDLGGGTLSPNLGRLVNLKSLDVSGCGLRGSLPGKALDRLSRLSRLRASRNEFTGRLVELANFDDGAAKRQSVDERFDLKRSGRSYGTPEDDDTGELLQIGPFYVSDVGPFLDLSHNKLSGRIPDNFLGGTSRGGLVTESNNTTKPGTCTMYVHLEHNFLSGEVPIEPFARYGDLMLTLEGNRFTSMSWDLCDKTRDLWMDAMVGRYGCDAVMCPSGTYAEEFGRAGVAPRGAVGTEEESQKGVPVSPNDEGATTSRPSTIFSRCVICETAEFYGSTTCPDEKEDGFSPRVAGGDEDGSGTQVAALSSPAAVPSGGVLPWKEYRLVAVVASVAIGLIIG